MFSNKKTGDKKAQDLISFIYRAMDKYRIGKNKTIFDEEAVSMGENPLSNLGKSATHFVRFLLNSFTAYMRNLPIYHSVVGKEYSESVLSGDNTQAKELAKELGKFTDDELLTRIIRIMQILEIYSEALLSSQGSCKFPTSVLRDLILLTNELRMISDIWA